MRENLEGFFGWLVAEHAEARACVGPGLRSVQHENRGRQSPDRRSPVKNMPLAWRDHARTPPQGLFEAGEDGGGHGGLASCSEA